MEQADVNLSATIWFQVGSDADARSRSHYAGVGIGYATFAGQIRFTSLF